MLPLPSARHFRGAVQVALLSLFAVGCGAAREAAPPEGLGPREMQEMEAIYRERLEAARQRFTEADVRFMTDMIHHHAQAIEISRLAPDRGASATIQTLAARIIHAQQDEITIMQRWLRDRDRPVPELELTAAGVTVQTREPHSLHGMHGGAHASHAAAMGRAEMPGMLSPEQISALSDARDLEFDRLFLTLMIEHHRGAVSMVHTLFATDGAGQDEEVFRFASDVQVDQATEVARMELMLSALPSGAGAP